MICKQCGIGTEFYWHSKSKAFYQPCKNCRRTQSRQWAIDHPEQHAIHSKKAYEIARTKVLEYYSGGTKQCVCCGETEAKFLTLDHIYGGGEAHRRLLRRRSLYHWLVANKFPGGFQILCMNCNHAKGHYGNCPHTRQVI